MSGTATIVSQAINIKNLDNIGFDVSWTGTPIGTITVQCSVDGTTYRALTFSPVLAQPAGSASGYLINLNQVPFEWAKISYTNSSGSGNLFAVVTAKDIN